MVRNIFGIFSSKEPKQEIKVEPIIEDVEDTQASHNLVDEPEVKQEREYKQEMLSEEEAYYVKDKLQEIIDAMGLMSVVKIQKHDEKGLILDIKSDDVGRIIGKEGNTLDALQFIIRNVLQRKTSKKFKLVLDANDYRARRKKSLEKKANRAAKIAADENREVKMGAMPPHERRIIHMTLEGNNSVKTYSKGDKNLRQVIVAPINT